MFVDLSGSTGVAEALGPEWTRDLFSAMQTLVEGEVTAHGGVVITYMGDGVLAVFGLPKPRSDDAARALATVEALHESMTAWLADLPPAARERLDFRIGLHFGPGYPVQARFADPTADHRDGRHRQRREPASGSGQAAALPRRRRGGCFSSRKRDGADCEYRSRALRAAHRFDSRSSGRFASSHPNLMTCVVSLNRSRHREERSDAAIQESWGARCSLDCFASLAMTTPSPSVIGQLAASA